MYRFSITCNLNFENNEKRYLKLNNSERRRKSKMGRMDSREKQNTPPKKTPKSKKTRKTSNLLFLLIFFKTRKGLISYWKKLNWIKAINLILWSSVEEDSDWASLRDEWSQVKRAKRKNINARSGWTDPLPIKTTWDSMKVTFNTPKCKQYSFLK